MRAVRSSRRAASSGSTSPGPAQPRLPSPLHQPGTGLVSAGREGEALWSIRGIRADSVGKDGRLFGAGRSCPVPKCGEEGSAPSPLFRAAWWAREPGGDHPGPAAQPLCREVRSSLPGSAGGERRLESREAQPQPPRGFCLSPEFYRCQTEFGPNAWGCFTRGS